MPPNLPGQLQGTMPSATFDIPAFQHSLLMQCLSQLLLHCHQRTNEKLQRAVWRLLYFVCVWDELQRHYPGIMLLSVPRTHATSFETVSFADRTVPTML